MRQTFQNTNEKLSSISINQLISDIQYLSGKLNFSTSVQSQWKASSNLLGNQKQRKLRQIKHDLYMAKRRNNFREKVYEQKYYILNGKKPPTTNNSKEDSMIHVYKSQLDKERNQKKEFHIIQDFDFIDQYFKEILQDAIEIEYEQSVFTQKSMQDIEKENETLNHLIHSYFYGVKQRDEKMRNTNREIFKDYEDDPFVLAFPEFQSPSSHENPYYYDHHTVEATSFLPKLSTLSMKSEADRERRRSLLLSSPPLPSLNSSIGSSSSCLVDIPSTTEQVKNIEHERVASLLTTVMTIMKE